MSYQNYQEADEYHKDGYYIVPEVVIPSSLIIEAKARIKLILEGQYETGRQPWRCWNVGDPNKIQKMDQVHLVDNSIRQLVTHSNIGRWAAKVTGAKKIQIWATQLFYKPPGGGHQGNVGWHTDQQYWKFWRGEVFSAWLALTDITNENGPIIFVKGSHRWRTDEGDAYSQDLTSIRRKLVSDIPSGNCWRETPAIIPAGGLSFHHRNTWHGSSENRSNDPRCNIVINLCTEKSEPDPEQEHFGYCEHLNDAEICPIIYNDTELDVPMEHEFLKI